MANSLPKKKYKLFKIFFVVFFLAAVCVTFPGFSADQNEKAPAAFAVNVIAFWNGSAAPDTKIHIPDLLPATQASHPDKNSLMLDKNKKVRSFLKCCNIGYGRTYADDWARSASPSSFKVNDSNDNPDCIRTEGRLQKDANICFSGPIRG